MRHIVTSEFSDARIFPSILIHSLFMAPVCVLRNLIEFLSATLHFKLMTDNTRNTLQSSVNCDMVAHILNGLQFLGWLSSFNDI